MMNLKFIFLTVYLWICLLFATHFTAAAPAVCRSCRGQCKNTEILPVNVTETEILDALIDNDTGELLNGTDLSNVTSSSNSSNRIKRESYIEKRTCSSRFQLELFMIPISIAMIPVALVSLLLCVCFCGPKDQRGQVPEKIMGVRLSQKRKEYAGTHCASVDESSQEIGSKNKSKHDSDEELDYRDGYVQRKDSKKTRFATSISFIEPIRRASSVSCLEGMNPHRLEQLYQAAVQDESGSVDQLPRLKKTRFSDSVSILGDDPCAQRHPSTNSSTSTATTAIAKRKSAIIQRSISVA